MSERARTWATWTLLALGALRLALLVGHEPMYGYANNYDFIRVSSWFHLWADPPNPPAGFDPLAQHPSAPISSYRIDPSVDGERYWLSSDLIFVWTAVQLGNVWAAVTGAPTGSFDLRILGAIRSLALLLAALVVTIRFRRSSSAAGLGSAAVFALVLADPVFSLLFNTLYAGFSTVLFTYVVAAWAVEAIAYGPPRPLAAWIGFSAASLLLALSKVQYIGLPLVLTGLVALTTLALHRSRLREPVVWLGFVLMIGAGLAGTFTQQRSLGAGGYAWSMRMGAATDTYFGAALPSFRDPVLGLRLLDLPEHCAPYIGKDWYSEGMQPPPCPEVGSVPRWKLVRLFARDPLMLIRVARRGLPLLQPFVVRYYGQVEGADHAQADLRWSRGLGSLATWPESLPPIAFAVLFVLTLASFGAGVVALAHAAWRGPGGSLALPAFAVVLGLVETYCFTTSWVGAGWIDFGRHSIVGQLAFLALLGAVPFQAWELFYERSSSAHST